MSLVSPRSLQDYQEWCRKTIRLAGKVEPPKEAAVAVGYLGFGKFVWAIWKDNRIIESGEILRDHNHE